MKRALDIFLIKIHSRANWHSSQLHVKIRSPVSSLDVPLLVLVVSFSANTPLYWAYWWVSHSESMGRTSQGISIYKAGDVAHIWKGRFHINVSKPQVTEFGKQIFESAMDLVFMLNIFILHHKAYPNNNNIPYSQVWYITIMYLNVF